MTKAPSATPIRSDADVDPLGAEQRAALGKSARAKAPLEAHAEFRPKRSRDPVALLLTQDETRVPELLPIRHGRMLVSPFALYRGAALVMAADLHTTPTPSLRTQLCGDAHLSNFGAYASPERRLVFDINDFDETLPGPFEWDVKRLAASFVVAGRENGFTKKQCRKSTLAAVGSYRTAMRAFADQTILTVWYAHLNIEDALAEFKAGLASRKLKERKANIKAAEKLLAKAHTRDSLQAVGKLTTVTDGRRRIISDPPLVVPIDELTGLDTDVLLGQIRSLLAAYQVTLQSDRRRLVDHFTLADVAHKVVGVGSVGTQRVDSASRGGSRGGTPSPAGQTGRGVSPCRLRGRIGIRQPRGACRRRPAPHAGLERHLSRLASRAADRRPGRGLLHPAAPGLENVRCDRRDGPSEHGPVRGAMRLDARPCARPCW
jgi:Uncharacterized protein conserved in bacteria (DUF2252)